MNDASTPALSILPSRLLDDRALRLFVMLAAFFCVNAVLAEFIGVKIFALEDTLGIAPLQWNLFGQSGSLSFLFERKGVFRLPAAGINPEELELELIVHGAEEIAQEDDEIVVYTQFADFAQMQKALEEKGMTVTSAEIQRIPTTSVELGEEQMEDVFTLVEKIEEDDDVQNVYHNMA